MRDTKRCPKCDHHEIICLPETVDSDFDRLAAYTTSSWGERTLHGAFAVCICRSCGFTEFYAQRPDQIPVEKIPGARLLVGTPAAGYRGAGGGHRG